MIFFSPMSLTDTFSFFCYFYHLIVRIQKNWIRTVDVVSPYIISQIVLVFKR